MLYEVVYFLAYLFGLALKVFVIGLVVLLLFKIGRRLFK